ncbi:MAG: hypothetical protein HZA48_11215 [Planctomycetes bacterium]|nr:hypothetical protein [Planctomycetota bacterium]
MVWFFIKNTIVITAVFCTCLINPMQIFADQPQQNPVQIPQPAASDTVANADMAANLNALKGKLSGLGYTDAQIEQVMSQLSDEDIAVISQNINQLQIGGTTDPTGYTLVVIALLIYIFLNIVEGYDWP